MIDSQNSMTMVAPHPGGYVGASKFQFNNRKSAVEYNRKLHAIFAERTSLN